MKKFILSLVLIGIYSLPVQAQTQWKIKPGPSSLNFEVKHLLFSKIGGKFKHFEGSITTNGETLENAQMSARVQTNSIYTGNSDRDNHLESKDFFSSDQFPEMTFISKSVHKTDIQHEYKIIGNLTIRGITKEVILIGTCSPHKKLANGNTRMDLVAQGSIQRFDFGLKWNELMDTGSAIVSNQVDLKLKLALITNREHVPN